MKEQFKRFLSLFLVFSLCFGMLPLSALAADEKTEPAEAVTQKTEEKEEPAPSQPDESKPDESKPDESQPDESEPPETSDPTDPSQPEQPQPGKQGEPALHHVTVMGGTAEPADAAEGTLITLTPVEDPHGVLLRWDVMQGNVDITGNTFLMPDHDVTVSGLFRMALRVEVEGGKAEPDKVAYGSETKITADQEGTFLYWSGDGLTPEQKTQNPLVLIPKEDLRLKAIYDHSEIPDQITVTLQVANGTWADGTDAPKTFTLDTNGEAVSLKPEDIPEGMIPLEGFDPELGQWSQNPLRTLVEDAVFTYSFAPLFGDNSGRVRIHVLWDYGYGTSVSTPPQDISSLQMTLMEGDKVLAQQQVETGWEDGFYVQVPGAFYTDRIIPQEVPGYHTHVSGAPGQPYWVTYILDQPEQSYQIRLNPAIAALDGEVTVQVKTASGPENQGRKAPLTLSLNAANDYTSDFTFHRLNSSGKPIHPQPEPLAQPGDFPMTAVSTGEGQFTVDYASQAQARSGSAAVVLLDPDGENLEEIPGYLTSLTVTVERAVGPEGSFAPWRQVVLTPAQGWNRQLSLPGTGPEGEFRYRMKLEALPEGFEARDSLSSEGENFRLELWAIRRSDREIPAEITFTDLEGNAAPWPVDSLPVTVKPWQTELSVEAPQEGSTATVQVPENLDCLSAELPGWSFFYDAEAHRLTGVQQRKIQIRTRWLNRAGEDISWPAELSGKTVTLPVKRNGKPLMEVSLTEENYQNLSFFLPASEQGPNWDIAGLNLKAIQVPGYEQRCEASIYDPDVLELSFRRTTVLRVALTIHDENRLPLFDENGKPLNDQVKNLKVPIFVGHENTDTYQIPFDEEHRILWEFAGTTWFHQREIGSYNLPVSASCPVPEGWKSSVQLRQSDDYEYDVMIRVSPETETQMASFPVTVRWDYSYGQTGVEEVEEMTQNVVIDYADPETPKQLQTLHLTPWEPEATVSVPADRKASYGPACFRPRPLDGFDSFVTGTPDAGFVVHYAAKPETYRVRLAPGVVLPETVESFRVTLQPQAITHGPQQPSAELTLSRENGFSAEAELKTFNAQGQFQAYGVLLEPDYRELLTVHESEDPMNYRDFQLTYHPDVRQKTLRAELSFQGSDGKPLSKYLIPVKSYQVQIEQSAPGMEPRIAATMVLNAENRWSDARYLPDRDSEGNVYTYRMLPQETEITDYSRSVSGDPSRELQLLLKFTPELKTVPVEISFRDNGGRQIPWPVAQVSLRIERSTIARITAWEGSVSAPQQGMTAVKELKLPIREPDGKPAHYVATVEPVELINRSPYHQQTVRADDFRLTMQQAHELTAMVVFEDSEGQEIAPPEDLYEVEFLLSSAAGEDRVLSVSPDEYDEWFYEAYVSGGPFRLQLLTQIPGFTTQCVDGSETMAGPGSSFFILVYRQAEEGTLLTVSPEFRYSPDGEFTEAMPSGLPEMPVDLYQDGDFYQQLLFDRGGVNDEGDGNRERRPMEIVLPDPEIHEYTLKPHDILGFTAQALPLTRQEDGSLTALVQYTQQTVDLSAELDRDFASALPPDFPEIPLTVSDGTGADVLELKLNAENSWRAEIASGVGLYGLDEHGVPEKISYVISLEEPFRSHFRVEPVSPEGVYVLSFRGGDRQEMGLQSVISWQDSFGRSFPGPSVPEEIPAVLSCMAPGSDQWQQLKSFAIHSRTWTHTDHVLKCDLMGRPYRYRLEAELPENYTLIGLTEGEEKLTLTAQQLSPMENKTVTVRFTDSQGGELPWPVDRVSLELGCEDRTEPVVLEIAKPEQGSIGTGEISLPTVDAEGRQAQYRILPEGMLEADGVLYTPKVSGLEISFTRSNLIPLELSWIGSDQLPTWEPVDSLTVLADGVPFTLTEQSPVLVPEDTNTITAELDGWTFAGKRLEDRWTLTGYEDRELEISVLWQDVQGREILWPDSQLSARFRIPILEGDRQIGLANVDVGSDGSGWPYPAMHADGTPVVPTLDISGVSLAGYAPSLIRRESSPDSYQLIMRRALKYQIHLLVVDSQGDPVWNSQGRMRPGFEDLSVSLTPLTEQGPEKTLTFRENAPGFHFDSDEVWNCSLRMDPYRIPISVEASAPGGWFFTCRVYQSPIGSYDFYVKGRQVPEEKTESVTVKALWNFGYGDAAVPDVTQAPAGESFYVDYIEPNGESGSAPKLGTFDLSGGEKTITYRRPGMGEQPLTAQSFLPHGVPGFEAQVSGNAREGFVIRYQAVEVPYTVSLAQGVVLPQGEQELQVELTALRRVSTLSEETLLFTLNPDNGWTQTHSLRRYDPEGSPIVYRSRMAGQTLGRYGLQDLGRENRTVVSFAPDFPQLTLETSARWQTEDGQSLSPYVVHQNRIRVFVQRKIQGGEYEVVHTLVTEAANDWKASCQMPRQDENGQEYIYRMRADRESVPVDYILDAYNLGNEDYRTDLIYQPELQEYPVTVCFRDGSDRLLDWPVDQVRLIVERYTIGSSVIADCMLDAPDDGRKTGYYTLELPIREPDGSPAHYIAQLEDVEGFSQLDGKVDEMNLVMRSHAMMSVQVLWQDEKGQPMEAPAEADPIGLLIGAKDDQSYLIYINSENDWNTKLYLMGDMAPLYLQPVTQIPGFVMHTRRVPGDNPDEFCYEILCRREKNQLQLQLETRWQLSPDGPVLEELLPGLPDIVLDVYCNGSLYESLHVDRGGVDEEGYNRELEKTLLPVPAQGPDGPCRYTVRPRSVFGFTAPAELEFTQAEDGSLRASVLYTQKPTSIRVMLDPAAKRQMPEYPMLPIEGEVVEADAQNIRLSRVQLTQENDWKGQTDPLLLYRMEEGGIGRANPMLLLPERADMELTASPMTEDGIIYVHCVSEAYQKELTAQVVWQGPKGQPISAPDWVSQVKILVSRRSEHSSAFTPYGELMLQGSSWKGTMEVPAESILGDAFVYQMKVEVPENFEAIPELTEDGNYRVILRQLPQYRQETVEVLWRDCYGRKIPWPQQQVSLELHSSDQQESAPLTVQAPQEGMDGIAVVTIMSYDDQGKPITHCLTAPQEITANGITYQVSIENFRVTYIAKARISLEARWLDAGGKPMETPPVDKVEAELTYREGSFPAELTQEESFQKSFQVPGRQAPYLVKPQMLEGFRVKISAPVRNEDHDYMYVITYQAELSQEMKDQTVSVVWKDRSGKVINPPALYRFVTVILEGRADGPVVWDKRLFISRAENWEKTQTVPAVDDQGRPLSYGVRVTASPGSYRVSVDGEGTDHIVVTLQATKAGWIPRTGDESGIGIWIGIGAASLAALMAAGVILAKKKKKK